MSSTTPPPADPGGPKLLDQSGGGSRWEPPWVPVAGAAEHGEALVAGGAVVGLAAGRWWRVGREIHLGTGAQPAEALPAGTIGYVSVDLDPGGGQKIEAIRRWEVPGDREGARRPGGRRRPACAGLRGAGGGVRGLAYADDVKPWLGNRVAVAAVDLGDDALARRRGPGHGRGPGSGGAGQPRASAPGSRPRRLDRRGRLGRGAETDGDHPGGRRRRGQARR